MRFTVLDLRRILGKISGNKLMAILNTGSANFTVTTKLVYVPFKHRSGTEGTMRQVLNSFDIDEVINVYEGRLESIHHRHVNNRTIKVLNILHKVKNEL